MASAMMTRRVDHLLLIFCLAFCFGSISAAPCYNYSWIEVPSASVLNTTLNVTVSNASDCQMRCYNNLTCTGYALDTTIPNNTRCYFNFALTNSSNSGITYFRPDTNISYFSLLRDTPSCGLLDSNCSYMWKGQKDLHGFDGVDGNRSTLNGCVRLCQNTPNCTGVDWNQQDTNCWINFNYPVITGNQPNITFFQRNCNDTVPATTKATTPGL